MAYNGENSSLPLTPSHSFPEEVSFEIFSIVYFHLFLWMCVYAIIYTILCVSRGVSLTVNKDSAC